MRVLSLAPSNTEIIYDLGASSQLIGTTSLCNYPEEAIKLPSVGGWNKGVKYEKIEQLDPDVIFTSDSLQANIRDNLEEKGFEIFHVEPTNLKEVYESIIDIGNFLNQSETAEKLVKEMKSRINSTDLKNKRIYCEEWHKPPMVSGNWIPELVNKANGRYFIEKGRSRKIDVKSLREFDPEYIFLNICGAGKNADPDVITSRKEWSSLKAVEENKVYVIDDSTLNRPTRRLVKGVKSMEKIIN